MHSAGFSYRRRPDSAAAAVPLCANSPYSVHFKTPLSGAQRALIAQRTHVAKWPRAELEDKYLRLLDEHHALKQENHANHEKIRKLVTRILRLTGQRFGLKRSASVQQCAADVVGFEAECNTVDVLQLRIIDLESYNAQLRDRLRSVLEQPNRSRCASASSSSTARSQSGCRGATGVLQPKRKSRQQATAQQQQQPQPQQEEVEEENDVDTMVSVADESRKSEGVGAQFNGQIVGPAEVRELKVMIERLHQELAMSGAETPVSRPCNACVESQSEQQRQAEENVRELAKQSAQYENQLRLNRQKINELNDRLDAEVSANKMLDAAKEDLEQLLRAAQQNNQDCEDISAENASLKKHRENIATLANELAARTANLREMRHENRALRTELADVRHHVETLALSDGDRMQKMRTLQDGHDALTVQLEGVRAQCACLEAFNRTLELENRRLQGL